MARNDYGDERDRNAERGTPRGGRNEPGFRGGYGGDVGGDPGAQRRWSAGGGFSGHIEGYGRGGRGPGEYGYDAGMARGPNTEWGGGYAGGYGRQGDYGRRGGYGDETGSWQGEWSGAPGGGPDDAPRRGRVSPDRMVGGGYGGLQGGGEGRAFDPWGDELQGGSYGRGWGPENRGERPGEEWAPRRPAEHRARRSFAGLGPRGYRRSDVRINEEICEALTRHPDIDATDVEVRVQNGEVTLSGAVDSKQVKRLAEDIADSCWGVTDVRNELRIGRSRSVSRGDGE